MPGTQTTYRVVLFSPQKKFFSYLFLFLMCIKFSTFNKNPFFLKGLWIIGIFHVCNNSKNAFSTLFYLHYMNRIDYWFYYRFRLIFSTSILSEYFMILMKSKLGSISAQNKSITYTRNPNYLQTRSIPPPPKKKILLATSLLNVY